MDKILYGCQDNVKENETAELGRFCAFGTLSGEKYCLRIGTLKILAGADSDYLKQSDAKWRFYAIDL